MVKMVQVVVLRVVLVAHQEEIFIQMMKLLLEHGWMERQFTEAL